MADFIFDYFARTTLGGAKNSVGYSPLTIRKMAEVIGYMKSPGSGPDTSLSYAEYVGRVLGTHPRALPAGTDYLAFSGIDSVAVSNMTNASQYAKDQGRAGLIGDTPFGRFVDGMQKAGTPQHEDLKVMEDRLRNFMQQRGIEPYN